MHRDLGWRRGTYHSRYSKSAQQAGWIADQRGGKKLNERATMNSCGKPRSIADFLRVGGNVSLCLSIRTVQVRKFARTFYSHAFTNGNSNRRNLFANFIIIMCMGERAYGRETKRFESDAKKSFLFGRCLGSLLLAGSRLSSFLLLPTALKLRYGMDIPPQFNICFRCICGEAR